MHKILKILLAGIAIPLSVHTSDVQAGGVKSKFTKKKSRHIALDLHEELVPVEISLRQQTLEIHEEGGTSLLPPASYSVNMYPSSVNIYPPSAVVVSPEVISESASFLPAEREEKLCNRRLTKLNVLERIQRPEDVTSINLRHNQLKSIPGYAFSRFPNLRRLELDNNQITQIDPNAFWGLHHLEALDLSCNQLETLPEGVFNPLNRTLETLNIAGNKIQIAWEDDFKRSHNLPDNVFVLTQFFDE